MLVFGFQVFFAWGIILMDDLSLFICGIVVTLISGMGVITSQVFLAYKQEEQTNDEQVQQIV